MPVTVDINSRAFERLLRGPGRAFLRRRAERTADRARVLGSAHGSLNENINVSLNGLTAVISCDHPAAKYVVFGTRPHLIRPVRRRALKFDVGGRTTYAKLVRHPGYRGDNFLGRALRETL